MHPATMTPSNTAAASNAALPYASPSAAVDLAQLEAAATEPLESFVEWLRSEAKFVRIMSHIGTEERRLWLARVYEQLADTAAFLGAKDPAQFDERLALAEASRDERLAAGCD